MWNRQYKAIGFTNDLEEIRFLTVFVNKKAGVVIEIQQESDGEIVVLEVDLV